MNIKRILSGILALSTLSLGTLLTIGSANAASIETDDMPKASGSTLEKTASTYAGNPNDLCSNVADGAILHAWCWSFKTIEENMDRIAAAGYTAIQTSPANACAYPSGFDLNGSQKMSLMGDPNDNNYKYSDYDNYDGSSGAWWWHYQPIDWTIGNYQLGYEQDYKDMCNAAHARGIKIITDIVANHTTNKTDELAGSGVLDAVGASLDDLSPLYHEHYSTLISNYKDRNQCTNYTMARILDVNTENPDYQAYVLKYCNALIADGCDGFRYDTTKHIAAPSDPKDNDQYENNFWPVMTGFQSVTNKDHETIQLDSQGKALFLYGEVLAGDNVPMSEYAKYVNITASGYGDKLRTAVKNSSFDVISSSSSNYIKDWKPFSSAERLVTWVESHDTYCNEHKSADLTNEQIRLAWAVIAARSEGTPLFFSRPYGTAPENGVNIWGTKNEIGYIGSDEFDAPEVVAVNKFRNAMVGQPEELLNPNSDTKILQINRGNLGTCFINLYSQDKDITSSTGLADGTYSYTYYDRANGQYVTKSTTVTNGSFTVTIPKRGITTVYTTVDMTATPSTAEFTDDSIAVKLASNTDCSYTVTLDDGTPVDSGSFNGSADGNYATTGTKNITIGNYDALDVTGTSKEITLTLQAGGITKTYTYVKREPSDITYAYFDNSSYQWNDVFAYVFDESVSPKIENASWPGKAMTYDSSTGYYKYQIPYNLKNGNVIFFASDASGNNKRYPLDGSNVTCGLAGKTKVFLASNNWTTYTSPDAPEEDEDLSTYNYLYFFNSMGWRDTSDIIAELRNAQGDLRVGCMKWSNVLHCYYYKYDTASAYNTVTFSGVAPDPDNSNNSIDVSTSSLVLKSNNTDTDNRGKVFVPTSDTEGNDSITGQWVTPNEIKEHSVYFENTQPWSGTIRAYMWKYGDGFKNCSWPGTPMENLGTITGVGTGDKDIYKYTYYAPDSVYKYNCVRFVVRDGSTKYATNDITNQENVNYSPDSNSLTLYKGNNNNIAISSTSKSIPVTVKYYNHQTADANNSGGNGFDETELTANVTAAITNSDCTIDVSKSLTMTNLYDDYTFYGSQYEYAVELASLDDDRIENGIPYAAFINPASFEKKSSAFTGVYNDSSKFIDTLENAGSTNWLTYYDSSDNVITFNKIKPDLSNVDHAVVYAFSKPKTYHVSFHYPTSEDDTTNITVVDSYVTGKYTADVSEHVRYNQLISETNKRIKNMFTPQKKIFDGWYMLTFNDKNQVTSYLKISSEKDYKYRITKGDINLYAVFRPDTEKVSHPKAAVLADNVDIFKENDVLKYRYNTIFNISNCTDNDNNIKEVGVVYLKLTDDLSYSDIANIKTNLKTSLKDVNDNLVGQTISGSNATYNYYHYTVGNGTNNTVKLTEKNRLQFVLTLSDAQIKGDYSNIVAFTVFKYDTKNGTRFEVSDNWVNYKNGSATVQLVNKN